MIPVEQLMVGDWVEYRHDFPDKIDGIAVGNNSVHLEKDGWQTISAINPIPLTPEILKKNGWQEDDGWLALKNGTKWDVSIAFRDDKVAGYDIEIFGQNPLTTQFLGHLVYVHELQRVLSLMKIGKEIEL